MKKQLYLIPLIAFALVSTTNGQNSVALTFTGVNNASYFQLENILVRNLTQGGDTTLFYPDTTLVLYYTGIGDPGIAGPGEMLLTAFPNPVTDRAAIDLLVPERDIVYLSVTDILGRQVIMTGQTLQQGHHRFLFTPGEERIYLVTARNSCGSQSIRVVSPKSGSESGCTLEYVGPAVREIPSKNSPAGLEFPFSAGDKLLMIGYGGGLESGIVDSPEAGTDYNFQFATNIPCPGLDSILYEGQWYHTIQVFSQCWLKENLNVGVMINGSQTPTNNGIIEKYCFGNTPSICETKGGLYLWEELMDYSTEEATQGICPAGWHLATDEEWKILEGVADSQYGIGHAIWNGSNFRGLDVAFNLKSTSGWSSNGNGADLYGFKAIPAGYWWENSFFDNNNFGIWWTSSSNTSGLPIYRGMRMDTQTVARMVNTFGPTGNSARCLKD